MIDKNENVAIDPDEVSVVRMPFPTFIPKKPGGGLVVVEPEEPYIAVPDNTPNHNIMRQFETEADRIAFQKLVTQLAIDNDCKVYVGDNGIELHDKDGNPIDPANLSPEAQKQLRQVNRIYDRSEPGDSSDRVTTTAAFKDYARQQFGIMAENEAYLEKKYGGKILYGEGGAVFMGADGKPITLNKADQAKLNAYKVAREKYERMEQAQADRRTGAAPELNPILSEDERRRICLDSAQEADMQLESEGEKPKETNPRGIFDHGTYGVTFEEDDNSNDLGIFKPKHPTKYPWDEPWGEDFPTEGIDPRTGNRYRIYYDEKQPTEDPTRKLLDEGGNFQQQLEDIGTQNNAGQNLLGTLKKHSSSVETKSNEEQTYAVQEAIKSNSRE